MRAKKKVTSYIKYERSYLKERFQSFIDRFENFKYKLNGSQRILIVNITTSNAR
ncbi:hypothetical protein [Aliarcobacter skirrowii]|uniref:hypothetical protein n=1 Tax=Aliarcobacter skirrowii TaxID=28200 RepID=UPI0029BC2AD5|nr:hypothetical protein [Aliarcobacter skirrowii]MDX4028367.1 hypothetical protein [Aliarcobacter skirrowii]